MSVSGPLDLLERKIIAGYLTDLRYGGRRAGPVGRLERLAGRAGGGVSGVGTNVLGPLLAGLVGLVGVVVGALVTGTVQARAARRTRDAADHGAARTAVRELLATSDITRGLYETVWLLDEGGRSPRPQEAYQRAVDAWADYQRARFGVRMAAPDGVYQRSRELTVLLEQETTAIDAVYRRETGGRPLTQDQINTIAGRVAELHAAILGETARTVPGPRWSAAPPSDNPAGSTASPAPSDPPPGSPTAAPG